MKKALLYASVASMIQKFNMNNIDLLIELGYKVDIACNFELGSNTSDEEIRQFKEKLTSRGISFYHIPISRKLTDIKNIKKSYIQTKQLLNKNSYDLIHCHSPIGGFLCRIANKNSLNYVNSKIIYTAHGFHFFKGNNIIKNLVYKSVEKYAAKYTDILITINNEDFEAAKKFSLRKNGVVELVPGVGIDLDLIRSIEGNREALCKKLHIPSDAILLLSVGELNNNKNHKIVIESLVNLPSNSHYIICGTGPLEKHYQQLANNLNLSKRLHLLGYQNNIIEIMKSCDFFIFPSKREGLAVSLMEAMASNKPCIASKIRGNVDLILQNDKNNLLVDFNSDEWLKYIKENKQIITCDKKLEKYSIKCINEKMKKIYRLDVL